MNRLFFSALIVFLILHLTFVSGQEIHEIKGAKIIIPKLSKRKHPFTLNLQDYWRGNIEVKGDILTENKMEYALHVPNLIEYYLNFEEGGTYDLLCKYDLSKPSPTYIALNGERLGKIFTKINPSSNKPIKIATLKVLKGENRIRLTGEFVETPFPSIKELTLVFKNAATPTVIAIPKVVGYRAKLDSNWYTDFSRKIHSDFHTGGFVKGVGKDFNGDEFAQTLLKNNINSIVIFAKDHHGFSFYNTKIGTIHPGLSFDLMQKQIDACKKYGIKVWVYFSIGMDELYATTQNGRPKQWYHFLEVDASPQTHYVKDYTWPMITEVIRDYDFDGFWFDFPNSEPFVQKTIELIKSIKPGLPVAYNHQVDKSREELKKLDILEIESWRHIQTIYRWQYISRYARGAVPLVAMTTRFWFGWGDFGGIVDEPMLKFEIATAYANGAMITIGDQLHPYGTLEKPVYSRIGKVLEYAKKVEPYVINSSSLPYIAILKQGITTENTWACNALVDAGLHFSVVDTTQDWSPYKLLVIPEAKEISNNNISLIKNYLETGGRIFVTGTPSKDLSEILGITVKNKIKPEPGFIRANKTITPFDLTTDIYTYEDIVPVEAKVNTKILAPLVWPMNYGTPHIISHRHSPAKDSVSGLAAITSASIGKGQAIYSAAPLLQIYSKIGYTPMRTIFANLVHMLIPPTERLAQVEAPVPLETSVTSKDNKTIVHLVHCPLSRISTTTSLIKDYEYVEPVIDGTPTVKGATLILLENQVKGKKLKWLNSEEVAAVTFKEGRGYIKVPDFEISAVLVIE